MNQSTDLTTTYTERQSFSFKRLGKLLQLDFAFHHKQWIQILISGILAGCIPVVVVVLTNLVFGMGGDAQTAHVLLYTCLFYSSVAVTFGIMISYNKRVNTPLAPLYLQIPASAGEKYISLVILTLVIHLIIPILSVISWTLYMCIWALQEGASVLSLYGELITTPSDFGKFILENYSWAINAMIAGQLASYTTYLFCIISARKPMRAILRFLGIGFGIFILSMICLNLLSDVIEFSSLSIDESSHKLSIALEDGTLSISLHAFSIPVYLYSLLMLWLGYRSLQRKQVKT